MKTLLSAIGKGLHTLRVAGLVFVTLLIALQPALALVGQVEVASSCGSRASVSVSVSSMRSCCCKGARQMDSLSSSTQKGPRIGRLPCGCNVAPKPLRDSGPVRILLDVERTGSKTGQELVCWCEHPIEIMGGLKQDSSANIPEIPPPPVWSNRSSSSGAWTLESDGLGAFLALFSTSRN